MEKNVKNAIHYCFIEFFERLLDSTTSNLPMHNHKFHYLILGKNYTARTVEGIRYLFVCKLIHELLGQKEKVQVKHTNAMQLLNQYY